uniref:Uncharacterized protein n=1 Tax=Aegilops tauschii subsp. strangulata TaxID=200361 RepID=A0A453GNX4_AEGTS
MQDCFFRLQMKLVHSGRRRINFRRSWMILLYGIEEGRCGSVVNACYAGCSMVWLGHLEKGLCPQGLLHASVFSDENLLFAHARTDATDQPRRCSRILSRGCAWSSSTSVSCHCSTPPCRLGFLFAIEAFRNRVHGA